MAVLRCIESFAFSDADGVQVVVAAGDLVDEKDRRVKVGTALRFEPVEVTVARKARAAAPVEVEQATAAPGEKRAARKAAAKD